MLGYDIEKNLVPKWLYLRDTLKLTAYDVTRFPAYFSYPLESVIRPRTKFLTEVLGRPGSVWGLNLILTPSDEEFAVRVRRPPLVPPIALDRALAYTPACVLKGGGNDGQQVCGAQERMHEAGKENEKKGGTLRAIAAAVPQAAKKGGSVASPTGRFRRICVVDAIEVTACCCGSLVLGSSCRICGWRAVLRGNREGAEKASPG